MRFSAPLFGSRTNPALEQTDFFRLVTGNTLAQGLAAIPTSGGMWLAWRHGYGSAQLWLAVFAILQVAILSATMVRATSRSRALASLLRNHDYAAAIELGESVDLSRLAPVERLQLVRAYQQIDRKKRARVLLDSLRGFPKLNPRLEQAKKVLEKRQSK